MDSDSVAIPTHNLQLATARHVSIASFGRRCFQSNFRGRWLRCLTSHFDYCIKVRRLVGHPINCHTEAVRTRKRPAKVGPTALNGSVIVVCSVS